MTPEQIAALLLELEIEKAEVGASKTLFLRPMIRVGMLDPPQTLPFVRARKLMHRAARNQET